MSNLLTDDELQAIRVQRYSCGGDKENLLSHIAAQADEIAALKSDLELLVKVSCREQRYKCSDEMVTMRNYLDGVRENVQGQILKAKCPDIADVLQKWQNMRKNK